ncbi:efflux RND transporter periplasmic adaptor subunit [Massilia sp. TS11]|uniref:efflux RND transporter periplasmic adaptor subunit n=1 Tax=Massilia sp. TS11 TaxID=2908003 RepID=UPI001EDAF7FF|nr:efflux RND transporter periplasmic adaptor subunit [Massilia sp. TS11]MCG2584463.1 efflux RND transporter periplasmic adaptor subunit [Massilia sp. TS11]
MILRTFACLASLMFAGASLAAPPVPAPAAAVAKPTPAPADPANASIDKDGRVRVQFLPAQQTVLSAEVAAKIARLTVKEGDRFGAGQVLVAFDCSLFQSQLAKAEAQLDAARQTLKVNQRLAELNSISKLEVEQAEAKVKELQAEASANKVVVSKCTITAPFSGRVAKVYADPFQYVQQGKPILDLVDNGRLELRLIVPSKWMAWLQKGSKFTVQVDELGREFPARVTRMGARIDPVSQTVSVAAEIEGNGGDLLPGMSGWANFPKR